MDARADRPEVVLRPSSRRRRTVTAYRQGDTVVVLVPARMSRREQQVWAERMVARITAREARGPRGDDALLGRARELAAQLLPELPAESLTALRVQWSPRQRQRWASCTPLDRAIRVSERLKGVPGWVLDDVLVHELAHLLEPNHSPAFWTLVRRHPRHDEAATWLDGYAAGLAHTSDADVAGTDGADAVVDLTELADLADLADVAATDGATVAGEVALRRAGPSGRRGRRAR